MAGRRKRFDSLTFLFASAALYLRDGSSGPHWKSWSVLMRIYVTQKQDKDGGWSPSKEDKLWAFDLTSVNLLIEGVRGGTLYYRFKEE